MAYKINKIKLKVEKIKNNLIKVKIYWINLSLKKC